MQTAMYHGAATATAAATMSPGRTPRQAAAAAVASRCDQEPSLPGSTAACHQAKQPRPAKGSTSPTGPFVSTASPHAPPMAKAVPRESATGASLQPWPAGPPRCTALTNSHRASVVKKAKGASGVEALPVTPVQRQVAIAIPAHRATSGRNRIAAIRQVSRHVPSVSSAEPMRAPVSLTPAVANPARWSQLTSAGFSTRSRPLKVGTTQSPPFHIASEQAAFRGSSSSHKGGPPRFGRSTTAASAATSSPSVRRYVIASASVAVAGGGPRSAETVGLMWRGRVGGCESAGQPVSRPAKTPFFSGFPAG